jgi:molybdate transport system ATP-binding protein
MLKIDIQKSLHGSEGKMSLDVNIDIKKGTFVALMGESGSGKTTLLRILAGLETANGEVAVGEKSWKYEALQKREIGFVFQDYALFENMTVEQNLLFVRDDKALATQLLEITELQSLANRIPHTLSGGQKQRVALCRAMMNRPKLLLMDEPFSALHPVMRNKLYTYIKQLHIDFGATSIMVSHDIAEVYALAHRVLVLEQGQVVADGSVDEVLKAQIKEVEVLNIKGSLATVCVAGELLELDVDKEVKVGQTIQVTLKVNT